MEKVFGAGNASVNERQISTLCNNIENKSILVSWINKLFLFSFIKLILITFLKGLVESLSTKIGLIETITQRVNQLNEKKASIEDQEKINRVNELYLMVSKWKDISATVPSIVERLTALNEIHQKGQFFNAIYSFWIFK